MSEESIYVGSAKQVQFGDKEPFLNVQIDLTVIKDRMIEIEQYIKKVNFKDGEHKLLNIVVAPMKPENRTEYKTHYVKVDKFVPKKGGYRERSQENQEVRFKAEDVSQEDFGDDIPF